MRLGREVLLLDRSRRLLSCGLQVLRYLRRILQAKLGSLRLLYQGTRLQGGLSEGVNAKFPSIIYFVREIGYIGGFGGLGRTCQHVDIMVRVLVHGVDVFVLVAVLGCGSGGPRSRGLLSSYLLCSEKAAAGAAGPAHSMLVAGLMEVRLADERVQDKDDGESREGCGRTFLWRESRPTSSRRVLATRRLRMR